jgi:hypothetical protein
LRRASDPANCVAIARRVTPAQDGQTLFPDDLFKNSFALKAIQFFYRQKNHAGRVSTGLRQFEAELSAFTRKKPMGNLDQNASAITRFRVTPAGAAMRQIDQDLNALQNDVVASLSANAGHKPNSARIMLVAGVVKSLRGRYG